MAITLLGLSETVREIYVGQLQVSSNMRREALPFPFSRSTFRCALLRESFCLTSVLIDHPVSYHCWWFSVYFVAMLSRLSNCPTVQPACPRGARGRHTKVFVVLIRTIYQTCSAYNLTAVAFSTSMPWLAESLVAAKKLPGVDSTPQTTPCNVIQNNSRWHCPKMYPLWIPLCSAYRASLLTEHITSPRS